jgi:hypothetical protein
VSIAQLASAAGLKVFLGVYEFPAEPEWTKAQVNAAIAAANNQTYGNAVIGIIVGNEDMFDYAGVAIPEMQQRIVADIKTIMARVSVPVTTAQRQGDWCGGAAPGCDHNRSSNHHPSLNQSDPYSVLKAVTVIGVNIFPHLERFPRTDRWTERGESNANYSYAATKSVGQECYCNRRGMAKLL